MPQQTNTTIQRCQRCGRLAGEADKFCAECGNFLRDAWTDRRLLLSLSQEQRGKSREAQRDLERLLQIEPDNVLANHILGTFYFHQGMLDRAIERYERAVKAEPKFVLAHYDLGVATFRSEVPWSDFDLLAFFESEGFAPAPRLCLESRINPEGK